jgi:hypothetical protein
MEEILGQYNMENGNRKLMDYYLKHSKRHRAQQYGVLKNIVLRD